MSVAGIVIGPSDDREIYLGIWMFHGGILRSVPLPMSPIVLYKTIPKTFYCFKMDVFPSLRVAGIEKNIHAVLPIHFTWPLKDWFNSLLPCPPDLLPGQTFMKAESITESVKLA